MVSCADGWSRHAGFLVLYSFASSSAVSPYLSCQFDTEVKQSGSKMLKCHESLTKLLMFVDDNIVRHVVTFCRTYVPSKSMQVWVSNFCSLTFFGNFQFLGAKNAQSFKDASAFNSRSNLTWSLSQSLAAWVVPMPRWNTTRSQFDSWHLMTSMKHDEIQELHIPLKSHVEFEHDRCRQHKYTITHRLNMAKARLHQQSSVSFSKHCINVCLEINE